MAYESRRPRYSQPYNIKVSDARNVVEVDVLRERRHRREKELAKHKYREIGRRLDGDYSF